MDKIFKQISTKINPEKRGWYDTDKGNLYWFDLEKAWSCRNDRISDEYPMLWYGPMNDVQIKSKLTKCDNCDEMVEMVSSGEFCPSCFC